MYEDRRESSGEEHDERFQGHGGRHYIARPKFCQFCSDKTQEIDYKNVELLKRFVTEEGKIRPRRQTGTCAKHQRALATEIKRSRHIALLPFVSGSWQKNSR
ncbi:MAG: 30S ribosomal protein S18 [Anaerolineaceae bacterium]